MTADTDWISVGDGGGTISLSGDWSIRNGAAIESAVSKVIADFEHRGGGRLDLSGVDRLDTVGAILVLRLRSALAIEGEGPVLDGIRDEHRILFQRIEEVGGERPAEPAQHGALSNLAEATGRATVGAFVEARELLNFLGLATVASARSAMHPGRIRFVSLCSHIESVGLRAMPIVGLLSFLIGIVVAYQGADQLRRFGAEIFTVNLLGVSMLREMAILMTAIIIAGRSGSAFTAQIGTMQVNEEIDAMRTMGLDPIEVLVLPRAFALLIAMPLLTVYADLMGLAGGALMSLWVLDISFVQFTERLRDAVPISAFWVGVVKAPVFGFVIALVGCREGLKVSGSAESVGRQTTRSVVISIFMVMILDAFFSIFFSAAGI